MMVSITPSRRRSYWVVLVLVFGTSGRQQSQQYWCAQAGGNANPRPYATDEERVAEHHKRGYSWPPKFHPDTPGWKQLLTERLSQIQALDNSQMKWDGLIATSSAALMHNFTEFGWGLTRAPEELTQELRQAILDGLPTARSEGNTEVIDGPAPRFIDRRDLTVKAQNALQPILEAWSGIDLLPSSVYGFRLYQNQSRLWMHLDRTSTHVISCIYHIASSDDAEPWPLVIEDYSGKTNAVVLTPGDVLLYESAKNFHGRPTHFQGSWYTSLFVHFYPADPAWKQANHDYDGHFALPPDWRRTEPDEEHPKVVIHGTSISMPDCPDSWCPFSSADHYTGPGEMDIVITGGGKKYPLYTDDKVKEEL